MLADVEVNVLLTDPPYSETTHAGQGELDMPDGYDRPDIPYEPWTPDDVQTFVESWAPRTSAWMICLTDHILWPAYHKAYESVGRYAFPPVPCCIKGMTFRKSGDGPASQVVYAAISRPRSAEFMGGWARAGFYCVNATDPGAMKGKRREGGRMIGGKPLALMSHFIRDYTLRGWSVADPCAGMGTTLIVADENGRHAIGAELDPGTYEDALRRLSKPRSGLLRFTERQAPPEPESTQEGFPWLPTN